MQKSDSELTKNFLNVYHACALVRCYLIHYLIMDLTYIFKVQMLLY